VIASSLAGISAALYALGALVTSLASLAAALSGRRKVQRVQDTVNGQNKALVDHNVQLTGQLVDAGIAPEMPGEPAVAAVPAVTP
jgi:hypothetical protein